MLSSGFGHVVNMSSIGGKLGTYRGSSYSAAKFGLNGMMDALCHEVECTYMYIHVHVLHLVHSLVYTSTSDTMISCMYKFYLAYVQIMCVNRNLASCRCFSEHPCVTWGIVQVDTQYHVVE